jgi:RNA polymerase sigma-70 factor (ECF subfamily)
MPLDGQHSFERTGRVLLEREQTAARALSTRVQQGDPLAFAQVWQQERSRLTALAHRMTGTPQDADDVVQEAFLSAWRAHGTFAGQSQVSTWLYRITANAALMHLRRRRRRPTERLDALAPHECSHLELDAAQQQTTTEQLLRQREVRAAVNAALSTLPAHEQTLLREAYDGDDNDEVAQRHHLTRGALKSRLYRSRQVLRPLLEASL